VARRRHRQHTREFKLSALAQMDTASDVQALARELGIERGLLYRWQRHYISGGAAGLRNSGRPRPILMQPAGTGAPAEETPCPTPATVTAEPPPLAAASRVACEPAPSLAAHDPVTAAHRIAELERKIGHQQLELDFFRAALRHVRDLRR
jgi:transposase